MHPSPRLPWLALLMPPLVMGVGMFTAGSVLVARGVAPDAVGEAILAWVFPLIPALYAVMVALNLLLLRRAGWTARGLLLGERAPGMELLLGLMVGVAVALVNHLLAFPTIEHLNGPGGGENFDPALRTLSPLELAITVPLAVAAEDLLYRGYSLFALRDQRGLAPALIATTLAYALFNLGQGPWMFAWAVVLGATWSGLALWRGGVGAVLVGHLVVSTAPRLLAELEVGL